MIEAVATMEACKQQAAAGALSAPDCLQEISR